MSSDDEIVFIVDNDRSVCRALTRLLDSAGYSVRAFESAVEFLESHRHPAVACLVLDISMPGMTGLELQQQLNDRRDELPIIFLTGHGSLPTGIKAMKRGATDFLTKPVDEMQLLGAVQGGLEKSRAKQQPPPSSEHDPPLNILTPREMQVLRLLLGGAINKQIASQLEISEKTVKAHRAKIMQKMRVVSPTELGAVCARIGIEASPLENTAQGLAASKIDTPR